MPTETNSKMILGSDLTDAQLARVSKYQKEIDERPKVDEGGDSNPGDGDKPAAGHTDDVHGDVNIPPADADDNSNPPADQSSGGVAIDDFLAENKTDKQALLNQLLEDPDTHLTLKGKRGERKASYADIKSEIDRGRTSQAALNKMSKSEEMEFGTILAAAKGGDKAAQKKAFDMIKEFSGSENEDGFLDEMDKTEGNFDPSKKMAETKLAQEWDEHFPQHLKDSVDYQPTLDKMRDVLRGSVPEKVYDAYDNNPAQRKIMFDLVAQGHAEKAMELFDEKYNTLPFAEQLRLDNDPAAWGTAFTNVFKSMQRAPEPVPKRVESKEDLSELTDSMSSGNSSRTPAPPVKKSYLNMTSKEFAAEKAKIIGRH